MQINGVTWVLIRGEHVLLERCEKKARVLGVGEWFVPGGKVDACDFDNDVHRTSVNALWRELREEWPTVRLKAFAPLPIIEGSRVGRVDARASNGNGGVFLMRPFAIDVSGAIPSASSEGTPLQWIGLDVALASPVVQVRMMVAAAIGANLSL